MPADEQSGRLRVGRGEVATVSAANEVLRGRGRGRGPSQLLPFLGPAFVAYVDPGNFATRRMADHLERSGARTWTTI